MRKKIGRYELVKEIGQGAMATVYEAFDPSINRHLAVKVLRADRCTDDEYRYRFLREARAAGNLSHPNIATVYDVGEADGHPYMAMELLIGPTLEEVMRPAQPLPAREVVTLAIQLAKALDYAHQHGVVHRDVKPANIVLIDDQQTVKLADFGIAHLETPDATKHTQMGTMLGTPQYMSPEQVEGRPVDGRSDLFSLGVILYQLITGQMAFSADTLTSLLVEILNQTPVPIRRFAPQTPPALQKIVDRLLQKRPERRFDSSAALLEALRRVLRDLEEQRRHGGEPGIVSLRVKWAASMAGIVALTMVFSVAVVNKRQRQAMTDLAMDYGGSVAGLMAIDSAEALLMEDWVAVETLVREIDRTQDLSYLSVVDHDGMVRGSTDPDALGKTYSAPADAEILHESDQATIYERTQEDGARILEFDTAITFQDKEIGRLHLGLPQAPIERVSRLTLFTMLGLMVAIVAAVVIGAYFLADRLTRPLRVLRQAMSEIASGHVEYRIDDVRSDELGRLFDGFNEMARALAAGDGAATAPSPESDEPASDAKKAGDGDSPTMPAWRVPPSAAGTSPGPDARAADGDRTMLASAGDDEPTPRETKGDAA